VAAQLAASQEGLSSMSELVMMIYVTCSNITYVSHFWVTASGLGQRPVKDPHEHINKLSAII
jgi:hypothetical protein